MDYQLQTLFTTDRINSIEKYEQNFYIATEDHLLHYHKLDEYLLITSLELSKIEKLLVFNDVLIVLSNRQTSYYSLPELSPCHMKRMKDVTNIYNCGENLMVLSSTKVRIISGEIKIIKEFDYPKAICGCGSDALVLANDTDYDLFNLEKISLFQHNSKPCIKSFKDEFLLTIGSIAMFIDKRGNATRGTLTWDKEPTSVEVQWPYVFAMTDRLIISSLETLDEIGSIDVQGRIVKLDDLYIVNSEVSLLYEDKNRKWQRLMQNEDYDAIFKLEDNVTTLRLKVEACKILKKDPIDYLKHFDQDEAFDLVIDKDKYARMNPNTKRIRQHLYQIGTEDEILDVLEYNEIDLVPPEIASKGYKKFLTKENAAKYNAFLNDHFFMDDAIHLLKTGYLSDSEYGKTSLKLIDLDKTKGLQFIKLNVNPKVNRAIVEKLPKSKEISLIQVDLLQQDGKFEEMFDLIITLVQDYNFGKLHDEYRSLTSLDEDKWPKISWIEFLTLKKDSKIELYLKSIQLSLQYPRKLDKSIFKYHDISMSNMLEFGDYSTAEKLVKGFHLYDTFIKDGTFDEIFTFYLPHPMAISHLINERHFSVNYVLSNLPKDFPLIYLQKYLQAIYIEYQHISRKKTLYKNISKYESLRLQKLTS